MRTIVVLAFVVLAAGCDAMGKRGDGDGAAAPPPADRRSKELESCARTADCDGELRCVGGACRPALDAPVADLLATRGDLVMAAGKPAEAAELYAAAVARYEADQVAPPARVLCAHGRALATKADAKQSELAARFLHRCLLATPPGAALHDEALVGLASLHEAGLDPESLARRAPVDIYLARPAAAPPIAKVEVTVEGDGKTRARSYRELVLGLAADPRVAEALGPCLAAHAAATQQRAAKVVLRFRHSYALDEDDDFDRATVAIVEPAAGDGEVAICARAGLQPIASEIVKKLAEETRWEAPITLALAG